MGTAWLLPELPGTIRAASTEDTGQSRAVQKLLSGAEITEWRL